MTSESREERVQRQASEQFAELGRFVQEFEQLVSSIRTACSFLLPARDNLEQMRVLIPLHHPVMTAMPLFDCMRALYGEIIKQAGDAIVREEVKVIRGVLKQAAADMQTLVKRRNTLLHATWYIGYANPADNDLPGIFTFKGTTTRDGISFPSPVESISELTELRAECAELNELLTTLHAAFIMRVFQPETGPRARFNFEYVNRRWRRKKRAQAQQSP